MKREKEKRDIRKKRISQLPPVNRIVWKERNEKKRKTPTVLDRP